MFVHSKLGRTALYGMTKDNTVEDGKAAIRLRKFTVFVHSKLGRTALYGMTKDNTVEDIRMAASEALGEPVLGISNDGRILDRNVDCRRHDCR